MRKRPFKQFALSLLLIAISFCCVNVNTETRSGSSLTLDFFDQLTRDIEQFDAEAIDTRNRTKKVSWTEFKKFYRDKLDECDGEPECARSVLTRFGNGFVSLHARFEIAGSENQRIWSDSTSKATPAIAIEYPSLNCFVQGTSRQITHLNELPINEVLQDFINYDCRYSSAPGCAFDFIRRLNANRIFVNEEPVTNITLSGGPSVHVAYDKVKHNRKTGSKAELSASMKDWDLVVEGNKFILLRHRESYILKFSDFVYEGLGGGLYCEGQAAENSLCGDIQLLTASIKGKKIDTLIVDVQGNYGGVEISPLIAALAKKPFYDLSIRFRKTRALENDTLRPYLFWSNSNLENWFTTLMQRDEYAKIPYGSYLPATADFCRGSANCDLVPIDPAGQLHIGKIIIVTNYYCMSSCDDFVWRMKDYGDADIAGQPHAADATYSLITLAYYQRGTMISRKEYGPGQSVDSLDLIFTATIPNSATVTKQGQPLQGVPAKLNYEVAIDKNHNIAPELYTLSQVLKHYGIDR